MPFDAAALSALAADYAKSMTSIRGRRVQRLLKREFAGAEHVLVVPSAGGRPAVLGLSATGAAFCCTDGRGKQARVVKWRHGSIEAVEVGFDLLKDSLPALGTRTLPLPDDARVALMHLQPSSVPPNVRPMLDAATRALGSRQTGAAGAQK